MQLPEDITSLDFQAERYGKIESDLHLRFRQIADEVLFGITVMFWLTMIYGSGVSEFAYGASTSVLGLAWIYAIIEWFEVRRLKALQLKIYELFYDRGYYVHADYNGEVSLGCMTTST